MPEHPTNKRDRKYIRKAGLRTTMLERNDIVLIISEDTKRREKRPGKQMREVDCWALVTIVQC